MTASCIVISGFSQALDDKQGLCQPFPQDASNDAHIQLMIRGTNNLKGFAFLLMAIFPVSALFIHRLVPADNTRLFCAQPFSQACGPPVHGFQSLDMPIKIKNIHLPIFWL